MCPSIQDNQWQFLIEATKWRYRSLGRSVAGFVQGKLKYDPVYRQLMGLPDWGRDGLVIDLGCGDGILLSALSSARSLGLLEGGKAVKQSLQGVELNAGSAARAAQALGADAKLAAGDVRFVELPACRIALLIDVLYHLTPAEQDALLARLASALEPGGALLIREADAGASWRYGLTWLAEGFMQLSRGNIRGKRHYRSAEAWKSELEALGLVVETRDMSEGTPFANVLFIARKPVS
jgi:SAM-dependent methyltransferase